jgi:hypothetical protein
LLLRVFREDVLTCPCGGRRVVLAYVTSPGPLKAILDRLGLPFTGPPVSPARLGAGWDGGWEDAAGPVRQPLR